MTSLTQAAGVPPTQKQPNLFVRILSAIWRGITGGPVVVGKLEAALDNIGVDVDLRERAEYLIREAEGKFVVGGVDLASVVLADDRAANDAKFKFVVDALVSWGVPRWMAGPTTDLVVQILKAKFGGKVPLLGTA